MAGGGKGAAAAAGGTGGRGRGRAPQVEGVHGGDVHVAEDEYARTVQVGDGLGGIATRVRTCCFMQAPHESQQLITSRFISRFLPALKSCFIW